ncbi:hypothetical protein HYV31_04200 [candidate division WWE3 bacterium]|nr:hypothetical protein [candidate division WWE3 bacterium]
MFLLPTQENGLYFILALIVAILSVLLAILLKKTKTLDQLRREFSNRELQLNKKLYETAVLKNKLEAMVNSMTEGVFMLDKDFSLLVINPACKKLLDLEDHPQISIFDIVRSFNKHYPIEETISEVFKTRLIKKVSSIQLGDMFFQITVIPIEVAEGVPGVGVLLHDETEAHRLTKRHEEFLAMVVHELRSPLTVIKGMSDILIHESDKVSKDKRGEILNQIRDSSFKLLEIVNTILEDTKMDLTKFKINKKKDNLNNLLEIEVKNYFALAKGRNIDLKVILDKTIPQFSFDNDRVTQVLNNLLSNAIKYTNTGEIIVKSELEGDFVKISVVDTGEGISDDKKPLLFQKFVQLDNSKTAKGPSTGLGLVIVKAIVEAHNGKIWIEDNKPNGAIFIFTLPLD